MSTTVYDFWKLKQKYNSMEGVQTMNAKIKQRWMKYVDSNLTRLSVEMFEKGRSWSDVMDEIRIVQEKKYKERFEPFDYTANMCLYYYKGQYYAMFFIEGLDAGLRKYVERIKKFYCDYFGYWNNTDPEEGVSWKDWKKRGRLIDKILGKNCVPIENALTFEYSPSDSEIINIIAPLQEKWVKDNLEKVEKIRAEHKKEPEFKHVRVEGNTKYNSLNDTIGFVHEKIPFEIHLFRKSDVVKDEGGGFVNKFDDWKDREINVEIITIDTHFGKQCVRRHR